MNDLQDQYRRRGTRKIFFIFFLCFVLAGMVITALCLGASAIGFSQSLNAMFTNTGRTSAIIWQLRLPRIVMAVLVGGGLAVAGSVFQAILKNPLASPYTLGIASSAGFGAVAAIVFGGSLYGQYLVAGSAFFFSLAASFLILGIARFKSTSPEVMILSGIAIMFLFSSLSSFLQYMGTVEQVHEIVFWFFGSLTKVGWPEIMVAAVMIILPVPLLIKLSFDLNLLVAGDESANALGVNVTGIRTTGVILASLITAAGICFTGVIGFIGLVAPHIARMIVGTDHWHLLPSSALIGATLVLAADTAGRTCWAPQVIPLGIVTSFIGVPFFFYLLMKKKKAYW
ncbi:iron ABC transporter permease [uncultured Desulfobacter sp.]|uniref:FecCD family ABC transporter permease n=1 Tax=uncultured Desulfobacter sp. TaxID=240139 RepID=UPI002AA8F475|nr:iron ABC transporter permease [uncultured Desulfobacter sp.]